MEKQITFTLNGKSVNATVPTHWTLMQFLREGLGLTGTKCSCAEGECGTCTVIYDGKAVTSCLVMAAEIDGHSVETIEGLSQGLSTIEALHPLQKAFIAKGAIQCGFCTPGMIMAAKALLDENPTPTEDDIKQALYGNLCRCTGYEKILDAVLSVVNKEEFTIDDSVWRVAANAEGHGCKQ